MDRRIVTLAAVLIGLTGLPAAVAAGKPRVEGRLVFDLPDLNGGRVSSGDLRGRTVLIDLWGTWCAPCLTEIATLAELQERYGEAGLTIVGIAFEKIDDDDARREHLRSIVEQRGIPYAILDGGPVEEFEAALPMVRGIQGLPVEILLNREGEALDCRNSYGYSKRWARRLERELAALLEPGPMEEPGDR